MNKLQASNFYQHFADNERPTIDYFVGLFNQVIYKKNKILTDFLNPREQRILATIVGQQLQLEFFGGYEGAERQRAFIADFSDYEAKPDFEIIPLAIEYNHKFITLKHADIYGALNNIGLTPAVYGDIIHDEQGNWQFFVQQPNMLDVKTQVDRIGRNSVRLMEISPNQILNPVDEGTLSEILFGSRRMDSVIAAVARLSRAQAKEAIARGDVKINWLVATDPSSMLSVSDTVSLRYYGRFKLMQKLGETKRGKQRFLIEQWLSKKR